MTSYTIYLIDDEPSICKGLCFALKKLYLVKTFNNAESALERMKIQHADLVLLDICLPGMDGIQALKEIKSKYPDILVIMLTAYEDVHTIISAMQIGAYNYLVKPIRVASLRLAIKSALSTIEFNTSYINKHSNSLLSVY